MLRPFIGDNIHIDGRCIGYRIYVVKDYLKVKYSWNDTQIEEFQNNNSDIYTLINQLLAIKQSCWLLRRTSYSCGSLSDNMYYLKLRLIFELREQYNFEFDDDLVEEYCENNHSKGNWRILTELRPYLGDNISIDGRRIGYRIVTTSDYLEAKYSWAENQIDDFREDNYEISTLLTQIIAIKQSIWLLRRTSHSCYTLRDDMYALKLRLIAELKEKYEYEFDEDFMNENCMGTV